MRRDGRIPVGIWSELGGRDRWTNEGVSRVIGFVIEGAAKTKKYAFHVVVQRGLAETVRKDLRTLNALEGRDWLVSEPDPVTCAALSRDPRIAHLRQPTLGLAAAALYCNEHIDVDGWFISFPFLQGSLYLDKPKATLMPDSLGHEFPLGWSYDAWDENGEIETWRRKSTSVCAASRRVITFSRHVARRHAVPLLDVPEEKIAVVPLAPPDLRPQIPFVKNRRRTAETHRKAATMLRNYATSSGIDYLDGFPFEDVRYVFTATQDRPSKNMGSVAEAVRRLVQDRRTDFKLLTTASAMVEADWSLFPRVIERNQFFRDAFTLRDVPREVHAALFHCAAVTVHPSFFEGIIGALPLYESLSVGTPCLLARGPHVEELLEREPGLSPYVFDPYEVEALADLIMQVAANREAVVDTQMPIYERMITHGWDQVAEAYAENSICRKGMAA